jgi:hypothetical protein
MEPQPQQAVTRWLSPGLLDELATAGFVQVDIDEMFDDPPEYAVRVGLDCLRLGLDLARRAHPDVDGILTIPLGPSDSLVTDAPSLSASFDGAWAYGAGREVVGLFLVQPRIWRAYPSGEEYRCQLESVHLSPGLVAYFQCSRTASEAASGWEYNRTIYIRTTSA